MNKYEIVGVVGEGKMSVYSVDILRRPDFYVKEQISCAVFALPKLLNSSNFQACCLL